MVITWEDALAASKAKGEAEGEAKGFVEATRNHIVRLERLEEILDQAAVVRSVDELVLEP